MGRAQRNPSTNGDGCDGFRLSPLPIYNGYNGVGGKGIDNWLTNWLLNMANYQHYRLKGDCYFSTVALAKRRSRLLIENIQGLRTAFREVKAAHPFAIEAVMILPDYLHCIWTLPEGNDDFPTRWRQIKAAFSRQLPKAERRSKS
jgi:REP element-mobilizing transposase RayT